MSRRLDADGEPLALAALAALAQESRLRIFRLLVSATPGGLHPGMIAEALDMPANRLSFHLKQLQQCGLIAATREGKFMRYRADLGAMRRLVDFLTAQCCEGQPCAGMPVVECRLEAPPARSHAAKPSSGRRMAGRSPRSN